MNIFNKMEKFLEKKVGVLTGGAKQSDVQPVEIAKKLLKVMEENKNVGVSQIYVPNRYFVNINQKSYEKMKAYGEVISKELALCLAERIREHGYVIAGELEVVLCGAEIGKISDNFSVEAAYTAELPVKVNEKNDGEAETGTERDCEGNTLVFARVEVKESNIYQAELKVTEGADKGKIFKISQDRANIGRLERNEVPILDTGISRLHAYIVWENGEHVIYDAQSLNGTIVNDKKIIRKELKNGDRILIGSTIIVYG